MSEGRWIVIPNWNEFQHYPDRDPIWIKNYRALMFDDDYLGLTAPQRGVLHGLWLMYAASNGLLPDNTASISRQLRVRVLRETLDALNHAGWIEFRASKPLALTRSRDKTKQEPPKPPVNGGPVKLTAKELRKYTGCRWVRGTHSAGYKHDPLGRDKPPPDWPHPKPSREEVELHLEIQDR